MFAINHAATALIIKKIFEDVPIIWILISVQFMELLWVFLNYGGIEKTTTDADVKYVGDIHLSYMPFSHSIVTMSGAAIAAWLIISKWLSLSDVGLAVGLGIASHLFLDLITHSHDIAIAPFIDKPKFGLGLYSKLPISAFFLEIGYGIGCWWIYEGSFDLLAMIVVFNLANLSMFFKAIPGLEQKMANRPLLITTVVLIQIVVTLTVVDLLS
jgi:hypothetical protein